MKCLSFVKGAMVALAMVGVIAPQAVRAAGPQVIAKNSAKVLPANTILDIGLTQGGTFTGRVVDQTGAAVEGAEVVIKQGKTTVTRTITDKQGTFVAKNMKGGVYTVASGSTEGTYRTWSEKTAPPSSREQALLVMGQNGARGQCGSCDPCAGGHGFGAGNLLLVGVGAVAIAGLAVGIAAMNDDVTVSP